MRIRTNIKNHDLADILTLSFVKIITSSFRLSQPFSVFKNRLSSVALCRDEEQFIECTYEDIKLSSTFLHYKHYLSKIHVLLLTVVLDANQHLTPNSQCRFLSSTLINLNLFIVKQQLV